MASVAAKHAEIDLRYKSAARAARDGRPAERRFSFAGRRVNELDRIFDYFYGPILPDDDAGADDVFLMARPSRHPGVDRVARALDATRPG
jgi:hypothetical protein